MITPFWLSTDDIVSWEPEGRYCRSKMFHWEPERGYCNWLCTAIAPFWFSTEHPWAAITPFWLSTDDMLCAYVHNAMCNKFLLLQEQIIGELSATWGGVVVEEWRVGRVGRVGELRGVGVELSRRLTLSWQKLGGRGRRWSRGTRVMLDDIVDHAQLTLIRHRLLLLCHGGNKKEKHTLSCQFANGASLRSLCKEWQRNRA